LKVLVVERDRVASGLYRKLLESEGHEVEEAADGEAGLLSYMNQNSDLVMMEWKLPEMDGIQLVKEIRNIDANNHTHTYLIMITSKDQERDRLEAMKAGVDEYITKPYNKAFLITRIMAAERLLEDLEHISYHRAELLVQELGEAMCKEQEEPYTGDDPVEILMGIQDSLYNIADILEIVMQNLDSGIPRYILDWCSSTAIMFTMHLHEKMTHVYLSEFLNRIIEEHDDWLSTLSNSSFKNMDESHDEMEALVNSISNLVPGYASGEEGALDELRSTMERFIALLRLHLAEEREVFYPFSKRYMKYEDMLHCVGEFNNIMDDVGREDIKAKRTEIDGIIRALTKN